MNVRNVFKKNHTSMTRGGDGWLSKFGLRNFKMAGAQMLI